jgi:MtN3 and saliva related transmembrane protein
MKEYATYIGIFAGVCTCISLLPQLIKIIREKKAENISYLMLIILLIGVGSWIWYGFLKNDLPIIITNSVSFLINLLVIVFTIRYKNNDHKN